MSTMVNRHSVAAASVRRAATLLGQCTLLGGALGGFGVLYAAARQLGGDYGIAGLSDDQVRMVAHFAVYGGLAAVLGRALGRQYLLAWLCSILLATGEEIHQLFVEWRFACVGDWLINVAGITFFVLAAWRLSQVGPENGV